MIKNKTNIYKELKHRKESFLVSNIECLTNKFNDILNNIPSFFSNFTQHDINHSFRVADYMTDLLPSSIKKYNSLELAIILISAMAHDLGMFVSEEDKNKSIQNQNFEQFKEEVRKNHHNRAEIILNEIDNNFFNISSDCDINFKEYIIKLAKSHGESCDWIVENLKDTTLGEDNVDFRFIAFLLRLGDLLDFDARRAPTLLLENLKLKTANQYSWNQWNQHISITNFKKIYNKDKYQKYIKFEGNCKNPNIYRNILDYFNYIEKEIKQIDNYCCDSSNSKYKININKSIENKIQTIGFDRVDLEHTMDYKAISSIFMGINLYNDRKVALREIIQNSIDACLLKKEIYESRQESYVPLIKIIYEKDSVSICDNGIGMTNDVIKNHFLTLGNSYYKSNDFRKLNLKYNPIGHYGIGFISSFMLSSSVKVNTASYTNPQNLIILQLEKDDKYVVHSHTSQKIPESKTEIILERNQFENVFPSQQDLLDYIKKTFFISGFEIQIKNDNNTFNLSDKIANNIEKEYTIDLTNYLEGIIFRANGNLNKWFEHNIRSINSPLVDNEYIYLPSIFDKVLMNNNELLEQIKNLNTEFNIEWLTQPYYGSKNNILEYIEIYLLTDTQETDFLSLRDDFDVENQDCFYKIDEKYSLESTTIFLDATFDKDAAFDYDYFAFDEIKFEKNDKKELLEAIQNLAKLIEPKACGVVINSREHKFFTSVSKFVFLHNNSLDDKNTLINMRNVSLSDSITIPYSFISFYGARFFINILDSNYYPNITRTELDKTLNKKLGFILGNAIYSYLRDFSNDPQIKQFISNFISEYYDLEDESNSQ